ncbi:MAG: hypothetical protein Q4G71_11390 [Pseudomonadota bacterium]|nr:hypothetical protein [Pseudomonadota bacterium]
MKDKLALRKAGGVALASVLMLGLFACKDNNSTLGSAPSAPSAAPTQSQVTPAKGAFFTLPKTCDEIGQLFAGFIGNLEFEAGSPGDTPRILADRGGCKWVTSEAELKKTFYAQGVTVEWNTSMPADYVRLPKDMCTPMVSPAMEKHGGYACELLTGGHMAKIVNLRAPGLDASASVGGVGPRAGQGAPPVDLDQLHETLLKAFKVQ